MSATANQLDAGRNYDQVDCYLCGMRMYLPSQWVANRRHDHKIFYCANGHAQSFLSESEAERLKKELAKEQERRRWAEESAAAAERSRAAFAGEVTKLRKRAAAGLCPCCNRSFQNLARHMKTQHPEEVPAGTLRSVKKSGRVPK